MPTYVPKPPAIQPYSRPNALAKLDGRRREAKLMQQTRAELLAHVGGIPSATQAAMIEQLVQLRLRLACMDRKFAEDGTQTDHDSRTYLAWANTYTRTLDRLGPPAKAKPQTAAQYLAARDAARAQA